MVNVTDDLNNSSIQTIEINVHPVNDPTIIYGDLNATIYADITTRGKISAKDIDGLHPTIIFEISNPPSSGFATIDALDGNWTYINDKESLNDDMFEISVTDSNGNKTFTNVNLTAQINPPSISTLQPVLTDNEKLILEGK